MKFGIPLFSVLLLVGQPACERPGTVAGPTESRPGLRRNRQEPSFRRWMEQDWYDG